MNIENVIAFLTQEWERGGSRPTSLVLVKLLYLLDLNFSKETGKTYTNWTWQFHNFGPYSYESLKAIEGAVNALLIDSDIHDSRFDEEATYKTFFRNKDASPVTFKAAGLPIRVITELHKTMKQVAYNPTRLLYHVYHQTEPMMHAIPNAKLNFEGITWPTPVSNESEIVKMSNSKLKLARTLLAKLKMTTNQIRAIQPIYDDIYEKSVSALNELDSSTNLEFSGTASVRELFKKD